MQSKFVVAALVVVAAGCTQQTGADEGGGKGWLDKASSAVSSNEWKLSESVSGLDGKTLIANRAYSFVRQSAQFEVDITCKPGKKSTLGDLAAGDLGGTLEMSIKSFVGDVTHPSEASSLLSETNFVRQNDYSNPAELSYPVSRIKIGDNIYSGPMAAMALRMGNYSNEAIYTGLLALGESIPMTIELKNGAGTFELAIDRSSEVERVLAACGQDEGALARAKLERQREQAKRIVLGELQRACNFTGTASAYDSAVVERKLAELALPPGAVPEVEINCEKSASEALAGFNDLVDQHYSAYIRLRESAHLADDAFGDAPACSRDEFMTHLKSLDEGVNIGAADLAFRLSRQSLDCKHSGSAPKGQDSPHQTTQAEVDAAAAAAADL